MMAHRKVVLVIVEALIPAIATSIGFEICAAKRSDNSSFFMNTIPTVARLARGKLLSVWSAGEDRVC